MIVSALVLFAAAAGPVHAATDGWTAPRQGPWSVQQIAHGADHDGNTVLTGRWVLSEIRLGGATERLAPDEGARYTLEFLENGTLRVQLFCNRGRGTWTGTPGDGGGALTLADLALTRASCPDGGRAARLATSLGNVVSSEIREDRLHLSLDAPGDVLVWRRPD